MEISYAPDLVDEAVTIEFNRREEQGDRDLAQEYRSLREPLYELDPNDDETEEAFDEVNTKMFAKLSLGAGIEEVLEEFSTLNEKVGKIVVKKAFNEEEANLTKGTLESGLKVASLKVRPQFLLDLTTLRKGVSHELMHLKDMVDEAFGYDTKPFGPTPMEDSFYRGRYRLIWDIYIDSRLAREGKETAIDKDSRSREFAILYKKIPDTARIAIFEGLWESERMTHTEILEFAKEINRLIDKFPSKGGPNEQKGEERERDFVLPGSPCPLCKFPTYVPKQDIAPKVKEAIKEDIPVWDESWVCERCLDLYILKADRPFKEKQVKKLTGQY